MCARCLLLVLCCGALLRAESKAKRETPFYTLSSIVNAASSEPAAFAPNTFATIFGRDLAFITRALRPEDVSGGRVPTTLPGTGVRVLVSNLQAGVFFVSPGQLNFLIPPNLLPGPADVIVAVEGRAGPAVTIQLHRAAPALFLQAPGIAVATLAGGSLISEQSPAHPGDVVILYATGLGPTTPPYLVGELARWPARLTDLDAFGVSIQGTELPPENILYAGLTPGFAGLYQVNLRLPDPLPAFPEIRIRASGEISPAGVRLPVRPR